MILLFASDFYKASLYAMRGGMWSGRASRRTQVNLTLQKSKTSAGIGTTAEHPLRKPERRANQIPHPRFDSSYCRAGTEACPYTENFVASQAACDRQPAPTQTNPNPQMCRPRGAQPHSKNVRVLFPPLACRSIDSHADTVSPSHFLRLKQEPDTDTCSP